MKAFWWVWSESPREEEMEEKMRKDLILSWQVVLRVMVGMKSPFVKLELENL